MNKRIREAAIIAGLVGLMITAVVFATPDPYALRMNNNDTSGYHTTSSDIHSDGSGNLIVPGDIQSGSSNVVGSWTFYTVSNKSLTIGPISALTSNTFVQFPEAFNGLVNWSTTAAGGSNVIAIAKATASDQLGANLDVGATTYIDLNFASRTNAVTGAFSITYATNGVDLVDKTQVRWLFNGSGSDQTLTIPAGWRTNVYSAVPTKITNGWITKMIVGSAGPTGSAALQTNCYVSFEYYH